MSTSTRLPVIDALAGAWNGEPFSVTRPARLRYADERLAIERLQLVAHDSSLVISGDLPLTERAGQGQIVMEGRANLRDVGTVRAPGHEYRGRRRGHAEWFDPWNPESDRPRCRRERGERSDPVAAIGARALQPPAACASGQW